MGGPESNDSNDSGPESNDSNDLLCRPTRKFAGLLDIARKIVYCDVCNKNIIYKLFLERNATKLIGHIKEQMCELCRLQGKGGKYIR